MNPVENSLKDLETLKRLRDCKSIMLKYTTHYRKGTTLDVFLDKDNIYIPFYIFNLPVTIEKVYIKK